MTILLYDYCELEERASRHLRVWKIWHIVIYVFVAIFGILNYVFLQSSMELIDDNCILYPRQLEFHNVEILLDTKLKPFPNNDLMENNTEFISTNINDEKGRSGRDLPEREENMQTLNESSIIMTEKMMNRKVLDTSRSLFGKQNDCEFAQYVPVFSTVFAAVWATMFTMCPGGGRTRSGIRNPWRILTPALLFALVLFALTASSFVKTNRGIQDFCSAFVNVTNATTCSSTDAFIERAWNASLGMGVRAASARAACAGVWASWACACALLLARCLTAPDFRVKRTTVCLSKDPHQIITPHLRKSGRRPKSNSSMHSKKQNSSPTTTSELVTVSLEHPVTTHQTQVGAELEHVQR